MDCLFDEDWDDSTQENRTQKANTLQEMAKDMHSIMRAALYEPGFSEYEYVAEYVIPKAIKTHGKVVLRCNEQGQEAAGQMLKRIIKFACNKRRRVSDYYRKKKNKDGEIVLVKCQYNKTTTVSSLETYRLRADVIAAGYDAPLLCTVVVFSFIVFLKEPLREDFKACDIRVFV